ncbi:acyl-ACP desaturase [Nonomuraea sp. NPDC046570]|uniref:acyl-ACP desaturase n=1 Tax=Nonomuraea sp. NPDC046570 TaxID=3155255 RepID=UPI0033F02C77
MIDFAPLEKRLTELLERHDQSRQPWTYDDLIERMERRRLEKLSRAIGDGPADLAAIQAAWASGAGPLHPDHAKALETAYLGETNLPWYTENLYAHLSRGHPVLGDFFRRWVAEEDQHGRAFEIYLLMDRAVPPAAMLEAKTAMLREGRAAPATDPFDIMVYTSIQELSTRVFYARLARVVADPILADLLRRVQADESLHLAFYREAVKVALQQDPSLAEAVHRGFMGFREPVTVLPDYEERKGLIWDNGLSNLHVFRAEVVEPLLRYWGLDDGRALARWSVTEAGHRPA